MMVEPKTPKTESRRDPNTGRFMTEDQYAAYVSSQYRVIGYSALAALTLIATAAISHHIGCQQTEAKYLLRDRGELIAKLDSISEAKPLLLGAGPDQPVESSPWRPGPGPEPYYPPQPRYQSEYVVTGEARRLPSGQTQMTIGFYPKDGRGMGSPLDAIPKLGEPDDHSEEE